MHYAVFPPDRLAALKAAALGAPPLPALSLGTVRDYCDSMDRLPELTKIAGDMKDMQRSWVFKGILASVPAGGRILEVGAGVPWVGQLLALCGYEVWVVDPYDGSGHGPTEYEAVLQHFPGVKVIRDQFGTHTPGVAPASFDAIYSISVLEHIPHAPLRDVIEMSRRSLKPGGVHLHAVDHVMFGTGSAHHLATLELLCEELKIPAATLQGLLATVPTDPEVYLLSAEAHNQWRSGRAYADFPMRRCLSVQFVTRQGG